MTETHTFTLILSGVRELTPELANAAYEATHGDIELNLCEGVASIDFTREATSLKEAIASAIREVESIDPGIRVLRVESEAANTIAKINAELLRS
jgi:hypothetical protein